LISYHNDVIAKAYATAKSS